MAGTDGRGVYWPQQRMAKTRFKLAFRIMQGGVPVDLTGDVIEGQITTEEGGGTQILDLTPSLTPYPDNGIVEINKNDTEMDLTPGNYWWRVTWIPEDDERVNVFYGPFDIDRFPDEITPP